MPRTEYDPLAMIPSPDAIRKRLEQTERLADRLRILLDVADRIRLPLVSASELPPHDSRAKGGVDA